MVSSFFDAPFLRPSELSTPIKKKIIQKKLNSFAQENGLFSLLIPLRSFLPHLNHEPYNRLIINHNYISCKNRYHNRALMNKRLMRAKTMAALTGNYTVLEALLQEGKTGAEMHELLDLGFDPGYVTEHRRGHFRHDEYACFDIWYCRTESRIFNVRRKVSDPR